MIKILITGANGQLGQTLQDLKWEDDITCYFYASSNLDVTNDKAIEGLLIKKKIDYVINCAAYTNVELAEEQRERAFLINSNAVKYLALACFKNDVTLIHISTDYVFDGLKNSSYLELDETNPINVYGESKLAGENQIKEVGGKYFILRTSWLYSKIHGNNFYKFVKKSLENNREIQIIDNQYGKPTEAITLANYIKVLIEKNLKNYGVYHVAGKMEMSWFDFAVKIAKERYPNRVKLISPTSNFKTVAKRPIYSVLSTKKIELLLENNGVILKEEE